MLNDLKAQLIEVNNRITKLQPNDSYFESLSRSFHLGMVGGSGRNTRKLNKRREASINKSLDNAKALCELYTKRDNLTKRIEDIESGKDEQRQQTAIAMRLKRVEMWRNLKAGDELPLGNSNGNPTILKKSAKSVTTTNGTKWTVTEIIGREAAKLL